MPRLRRVQVARGFSQVGSGARPWTRVLAIGNSAAQNVLPFWRGLRGAVLRNGVVGLFLRTRPAAGSSRVRRAARRDRRVPCHGTRLRGKVTPKVKVAQALTTCNRCPEAATGWLGSSTSQPHGAWRVGHSLCNRPLAAARPRTSAARTQIERRSGNL